MVANDAYSLPPTAPSRFCSEMFRFERRCRIFLLLVKQAGCEMSEFGDSGPWSKVDFPPRRLVYMYTCGTRRFI